MVSFFLRILFLFTSFLLYIPFILNFFSTFQQHFPFHFSFFLSLILSHFTYLFLKLSRFSSPCIFYHVRSFVDIFAAILLQYWISFYLCHAGFIFLLQINYQSHLLSHSFHQFLQSFVYLISKSPPHLLNCHCYSSDYTH